MCVRLTCCMPRWMQCKIYDAAEREPEFAKNVIEQLGKDAKILLVRSLYVRDTIMHMISRMCFL